MVHSCLRRGDTSLPTMGGTLSVQRFNSLPTMGGTLSAQSSLSSHIGRHAVCAEFSLFFGRLEGGMYTTVTPLWEARGRHVQHWYSLLWEARGRHVHHCY